MEQSPELKPKQEEIAIDMASFRNEIFELIKKIEKEKISGSTELIGVNPNDLTEVDARMWYKYKSNSIIQTDIDESSVYHKDVEKDKKNPNYNSRENFRAFFRQVFTYPWLLEQQKKHEDSLRKEK